MSEKSLSNRLRHEAIAASVEATRAKLAGREHSPIGVRVSLSNPAYQVNVRLCVMYANAYGQEVAPAVEPIGYKFKSGSTEWASLDVMFDYEGPLYAAPTVISNISSSEIPNKSFDTPTAPFKIQGLQNVHDAIIADPSICDETADFEAQKSQAEGARH
jgi:hypothetical protein